MDTCKFCNGTGDTGHGYLDCAHCNAATERAAFEKAAKQHGIPVNATTWSLYQQGKAQAQAERSGVVA